MSAYDFARAMIRKRLPTIERYTRAGAREHAKAAILQAAINHLADRAGDRVRELARDPVERSRLIRIREYLATLRYLEEELAAVRSSGEVLIVDRFAAVSIDARIRRYENGTHHPNDGEDELLQGWLSAILSVQDLIEVFEENRPPEK